jgi:hypothetical protein
MRNSRMILPIREATCRTWDENGLAVWMLQTGKDEMPGKWVIVDMGFTPAI